MNEISVHDNIVIGYTVSCEKKEIVIHSEFRDNKLYERTDVIFRGVEAYHIIYDNMQSILFDIIECSIEEILKDFSSEFESGIKWAWPGWWNASSQSCREHFAEQHCKGWLIDCSFGMIGFVIAKDMELRKL